MLAAYLLVPSDGDRLILATVLVCAEALFQRLENTGAAGHPPVFPFDVQELRLELEEFFVLAANFRKQSPIVSPQQAVIGTALGERSSCDFLVDGRHGVVELVLFVEPYPANLEFGEGDEFPALASQAALGGERPFVP